MWKEAGAEARKQGNAPSEEILLVCRAGSVWMRAREARLINMFPVGAELLLYTAPDGHGMSAQGSRGGSNGQKHGKGYTEDAYVKSETSVILAK